MPDLTLVHIVNAPARDTWASWDDFANINAFTPNLRRSSLIDDRASSGLGAQRLCELADGRNYLRERITAYVPGHMMDVEIYESTLPLKSASARVTVSPVTDHQSRVSFTFRFEPAMGLLGRMMVPMMKARFARMLRKMLEENAALVEARVPLRAVA